MKILTFAKLAFRKASADDLRQKSAALAFITLTSLIPLLASLTSLGARWFSEQQTEMVELFNQLLPYSEDKILATIEQSLRQAESIRGFGFVLFILTSLTAFMTVEDTINKIWNAPKKRPFRTRFLSFTLLIFWGPLVIGATYSSLFFLRQQALRWAEPSNTIKLLPFLVTLMGLSILYWLVPSSPVRFKSAFWGALGATVLLELLRQVFGLYVSSFTTISLLYGSLGLAILFLLSLMLAWWIILLGSAIAYCFQNYDLLTQGRRSAATYDGVWLAIAAIAVMISRFRDGEPITPHELLAERLQLQSEALDRILEPIIEAGIICKLGSDAEGYLLGSDPYRLEIHTIFELFEASHSELLERLPDTAAAQLEALRSRFAASRRENLGDLTLAELLSDPQPTA